MQNTQQPDSNHLQFYYQLHFPNFTQITSGTATRKKTISQTDFAASEQLLD